jgi:hypothetical protein
LFDLKYILTEDERHQAMLSTISRKIMLPSFTGNPNFSLNLSSAKSEQLILSLIFDMIDSNKLGFF